MRNNLISFVLSFIFILTGAYSSLNAQPYEYAVFHVPGLGDFLTEAWDVNENGIVVGLSYPQGKNTFHAFFSDSRSSLDLGTFGGSTSRAWGINNSNHVVGQADTNAIIPHAFLWKFNTGKIDLGTLGGPRSFAGGINEDGMVVGESDTDEPNTSHAFLWVDGQFTELLAPDSNWISSATDINSNGVIVGEGWNDLYGTFRPIMWKDGVGTDLGSLGDGMNRGEAWGINDFDQVVGASWSDQRSTNHPFLWVNGTIYSLSQKQGFARDINNQGQVVGAVFKGSKGFGFIWEQSKGLRFLEDLIPPDTGFRISSATGISDKGYISAKGLDPNSCQTCNQSFLLSPVNPEMVLSDPVPGVAGVVNSWTVTGAAPGAKVTLVYGFKGGGTFVPGCNVLDAAVQIDGPKVIKTVVADGSGVAKLDMFVPGVAKGLGGILVQAVSLDVCQESQLTVVNFQ